MVACSLSHAFKTVLIYQGHKKLKVLFLAVMRCCCKKQEMPCCIRKQSSKLKALCVPNLSTPDGCGHFVRLVTHHEIPLGKFQFFLNDFIARQLV